MRSAESIETRSPDPPAALSAATSRARITAGAAPTSRNQPFSESRSSRSAAGWLHGSSASTERESSANRAMTRAPSARSASVIQGMSSPHQRPSTRSKVISPGSAM